MIVKLEILVDVSEDFIDYHESTNDNRSIPQVVLDTITDRFDREDLFGVQVIMAESIEGSRD